MAADGGSHDWWPVLIATASMALMRLIDILLPRGTRVKLPEKYFLQDKDKDEPEEEPDEN